MPRDTPQMRTRTIADSSKTRQRLNRWRRLARVVLILLVILGLTPGGEALVEAAGHLLHDGHLPHSAAHEQVAASEDHAGSGSCAEHGCSPSQHVCQCCSSLPMLPPELSLPDGPTFRYATVRVRVPDPASPALHSTSPPVPPPIA